MQLLLLHLDDVAIVDTRAIEEKVDRVLSTAQHDSNFDWFDWYAVGGRWQDWLTEKTRKDLWPDQLENPNAIQITPENKKIVLNLLDEVDDIRKNTLDTYIEKILEDPQTLEEYLRSDEETRHSQFTYRVVQALAIKDNDWTYESSFIDTENWYTSSTSTLRQAIAGDNKYGANIEEYALVVIDFHH
jgi:hypothetical protein